MNKDWQNKIDAYLRNEMNAEDRIQFEEEMRNNKELFQVMEQHRLIIQRLSKRQEKLDKIKSWQKKKSQKKKIYMSMAGVGIAASILFGTFIIKPFLYSTKDGNMQSIPSFELKDKDFSNKPKIKSMQETTLDSLKKDSIRKQLDKKLKKK